jgi:hypothetical protein
MTAGGMGNQGCLAGMSVARGRRTVVLSKRPYRLFLVLSSLLKPHRGYRSCCLAFLAFFAPWRLGVLKMNSQTAAKGGFTYNSNCQLELPQRGLLTQRRLSAKMLLLCLLAIVTQLVSCAMIMDK